MNKKRLFHFNSCVYNVIVSGEENNQKATSVMKQKNNTLVFSDIHLHTVKAVPRRYFQDLSKNKNIKKGVVKTSVELRQYQKDLLNNLWKSLKNNNRILVQAPTGS